jgi:hypothetical protein
MVARHGVAHDADDCGVMPAARSCNRDSALLSRARCLGQFYNNVSTNLRAYLMICSYWRRSSGF